MDNMPVERHEHSDIDAYGERHEEEDLVAHRQNEIYRINGFVWLILGVIEAFIGLRVILKLLAADPNNSFASFVYRVSRVFLMPFFGIVGEPTANGSTLEISSIVGGLVYLLIFWGITRLVYLLMMPSHVRHVRTVQRH